MTRLQESLARDPSGYELRNDPTALAPERLLVFEVTGSIQKFVNAVRRVPGLEFIGEEELPPDEEGYPVLYLMVPDMQALREILSLWERWDRGKPFDRGLTPWRDVFACLRDLRPWGPQDRVSEPENDILREEIEGRSDDETIRLEIELVFFSHEERAGSQEEAVRAALEQKGGKIIACCRLPEIAYHALLVDLPVQAVRAIVERSPDGIAGLDSVMHIRPQSFATGIDISETTEGNLPPAAQLRDEPILALIDGVPVSEHPLLRGRLSVVDEFELEKRSLVEARRHGTAMASLILYGDRNKADEPVLSRKIHVVPVMEAGDGGETFPRDRLAVDVIYNAVRTIRERGDAPDVIIVNLSLGNARLRFHGIPSPWARLLDQLAWRYGLLFVVSAGNITDGFTIPTYQSRSDLEDAAAEERSKAVIAAVDAVKADRRLLAPAESLNALTIGAANISWTPAEDRARATTVVDPHADIVIANPSSALGPGIGNAVKPDVLFPAGKECLLPVGNGDRLRVKPISGRRHSGLRVASPSSDGVQNQEGYTSGTSAAAALASRLCHRIHDALEEWYGEEFLNLPHYERAVLLKALAAHTARWPAETADRILSIVGPENNRQHQRQRDNIRRYLGYGIVDMDEAVACAVDRATFWAAGRIAKDSTVDVRVPIPLCVGREARTLHFSATLAWLTPTHPGRQSYKAVKLNLERSNNVLRIYNVRWQPDVNQSKRGTLITRRWQRKRANIVGQNNWETISIARMPDQG
ncbi:MAG: hypothetical protein D6740_07985, partial [Alphaproteobacteria bacterium]